jgi:hypothetical protein
MIIIY